MASASLNDNSAIWPLSSSHLNTTKKNQELKISSGILNFNSLIKVLFLPKPHFPFTLKFLKIQMSILGCPNKLSKSSFRTCFLLYRSIHGLMGSTHQYIQHSYYYLWKRCLHSTLTLSNAQIEMLNSHWNKFKNTFNSFLSQKHNKRTLQTENLKENGTTVWHAF